MPRAPQLANRFLLATLSLSYWVGAAAQANNANPNYAAIKEYGRIEWHGATATLIAGSSRPLDMVASTLSTCLGISISAEDPQYRYLGDLLDVTAPQWAAQHQNDHLYAARPGKVEVTFPVHPDGSPLDTTKLLADAAEQVNKEQPYSFKVYTRVLPNQTLYGFVPTRAHDENGRLRDAPAYLDTRITIPPQTNTISNLASEMARQLSESTGLHFDCCQAFVAGIPWGGGSVTYQAKHIRAREVIEDLIVRDGSAENYSLRCQPLDKRFCFINVGLVADNRRGPRGQCAAAGYRPN